LVTIVSSGKYRRAANPKGALRGEGGLYLDSTPTKTEH